MVDNNRSPSDAPKPVTPPPPPTDNSAARKAASAVANQEIRKPSAGDLLKTNVQDKATQLKQGATLAAERVGGAAKGLSDHAGRGVDALQRKTGQVVDGAKNAPGRIKEAVHTAPDKIKDAVKAAPGKIKEEVTERPISNMAKIGLSAAEHATGTHMTPAFKNEFNTIVRGTEPYLMAKGAAGLERAGAFLGQAKAKATETAEAAKAKFEKISKDERGGTLH